MEFRRATPQEADSILQFWKESGASTSATDEVEYLRRAISNPSAVLLLVMDGNQIVGSILGTFDGWRGNIYRLVVRPSHRRQGIARQLVRHTETVFREWGVRRITALVEVDRPWARAFWDSVGYPHDERIVRHLGTL